MNNPKNCGKISPHPYKVETSSIDFWSNGIGFATVNNKVEIEYMSFIRKKLQYFVKGKFISFCIFLFFFFLFTVLFTGCKNRNNKTLSSPPGYNLNKPTIVKLPSYLDEISGIAYHPKDKSAFAISDEKGWLYKIGLSGNMGIQKWKFAKKEDFEDLVLVDSTFYVLESVGAILSLRFFSHDSFSVKEYKLPLPGKNEFEILYHDKELNRLIMLCKDCEADEKNTLSSWAFDLSTLSFSSRPAYIIDVHKIEELMHEKKVKFKPSAAAIQPLTGQLFIVSSLNKVIVVADKNGNPEKTYRITPKLYRQPEGLTFTPEGTLLISNESAGIGASDILIFKYNPGQ